MVHWVLKVSVVLIVYGVCYFGCLKGLSKSVQVVLNGIEAVMVLTFDSAETASSVL